MIKNLIETFYIINTVAAKKQDYYSSLKSKTTELYNQNTFFQDNKQLNKRRSFLEIFLFSRYFNKKY